MLERVRPFAGVVLDVGTGDGKWVLRRARADPSRFFIGLDANAENLAEASHRAARKPARGGSPNALYVHAGAEALPPELEGIATELNVLLPWGALLRAVALPDVSVLRDLARTCRPGAELGVVFGYDVSLDTAAAGGLPPLTEEALRALPARYAEAGFEVAARRISNRDVAAFGSTWSGRLGHGRSRQFCELRGTRLAAPIAPVL